MNKFLRDEVDETSIRSTVILHVAPITHDKVSGLTFSIPRLVKALDHLGLSTGLLTTSASGPYETPQPYPIIYRRNLPIDDAIAAMPEPLNTPDLIVFHSTYILQHILLVQEANQRKIPYVICPRGGMTSGAQQVKGIKKFLGNLLFFNWMVRNAVAIHCLTKREAIDVQKIWNCPVFVVGNGVNLTPVEALATPGTNAELKFIFLGRLDIHHKGLDLLLEACRILQGDLRTSKVQILLYGSEVAGSKVKLAGLINHYQIQDLVQIQDPVWGEEAKTAVFQSADLFIHTSRFEGHPMAVLEALSYGIPCLLTPGTNMAAEVEAAGAGWAVEPNPVAIAQGMKQILAARSELSKSGNAARKLVENQYSWEQIAKQLLREYLKSLDSRKLIYLHQYFSAPTTASGTRSWEFSTRLVRDHWQVSMICSNSNIGETDKDEILNLFNQDIDPYQTLDQGNQFHLNIIPSTYSNHMSFLRRIMAFLRFAIQSSLKILRDPKADLTFATSTPLTIAIPALLRKWLRGTPYVFEVRDLWPEMPIAVKAIRSPLAIFLARRLEQLAYQNASYIVALSPGMKAGIVKQGIPPEKVEVIPNSCDNDRFNISESVGREFLQAHPELSGGPLIIYAGTFGRINGVTYLAELANHMQHIIPEARFLAVGTGACEQELRQVSRQLGILENNFWIWSPIPKQEMPALLSACTVATSLFKPIPEMENNSANKFFDALSAGRPVVINYGGWQKDILEESGAGISIPSHDPTEGADQLAQFLNRSERLERAKAAARQLADTEFDRDILYKKLVNVFGKVLNET